MKNKSTNTVGVTTGELVLVYISPYDDGSGAIVSRTVGGVRARPQAEPWRLLRVEKC